MAGPLTALQGLSYEATKVKKDAWFPLVRAINDELDDNARVRGNVLSNSFDAHWPGFAERVDQILATNPGPTTQAPTTHNLVEQVLVLARTIASSLESSSRTGLHSEVLGHVVSLSDHFCKAVLAVPADEGSHRIHIASAARALERVLSGIGDNDRARALSDALSTAGLASPGTIEEVSSLWEQF
jgi:hypothetical protein